MTSNPKILVVDDEERIRKLLRMYLERINFIVEDTDDGKDALSKALKNNYDLIILDLMLPSLDGREICLSLRNQRVDTPIIMLTASGDEMNRIRGFELGADDYVVKPFSPHELVMRVKALLKRNAHSKDLFHNAGKNVMKFNELTIDIDARKVMCQNVEVDLTPKEFELLTFLAQNPDKVFTREELLKDVWEYQYFGDQRTVDQHIKRLREKVGKVSVSVGSWIVTVWGVGYKFEMRE